MLKIKLAMRKTKKLIEFIDEESWVSESTDIKGDIYEALLQKMQKIVVRDNTLPHVL